MALSLGALRWFPPVPIVTVADVALVHLHFDARRDDRASCKAVRTILADGATLLWLVDGVDTLRHCTVRHYAVHLVVGFTPTPLARGRLELLQDFVAFPMVFTKVFHFLALGAAAIVFHFRALGVNPRALGLVADRSILCTNTRTV